MQVKLALDEEGDVLVASSFVGKLVWDTEATALTSEPHTLSPFLITLSALSGNAIASHGALTSTRLPPLSKDPPTIRTHIITSLQPDPCIKSRYTISTLTSDYETDPQGTKLDGAQYGHVAHIEKEKTAFKTLETKNPLLHLTSGLKTFGDFSLVPGVKKVGDWCGYVVSGVFSEEKAADEMGLVDAVKGLKVGPKGFVGGWSSEGKLEWAHVLPTTSAFKKLPVTSGTLQNGTSHVPSLFLASITHSKYVNFKTLAVFNVNEATDIMIALNPSNGSFLSTSISTHLPKPETIPAGLSFGSKLNVVTLGKNAVFVGALDVSGKEGEEGVEGHGAWIKSLDSGSLFADEKGGKDGKVKSDEGGKEVKTVVGEGKVKETETDAEAAVTTTTTSKTSTKATGMTTPLPLKDVKASEKASSTTTTSTTAEKLTTTSTATTTTSTSKPTITTTDLDEELDKEDSAGKPDKTTTTQTTTTPTKTDPEEEDAAGKPEAAKPTTTTPSETDPAKEDTAGKPEVKPTTDAPKPATTTPSKTDPEKEDAAGKPDSKPTQKEEEVPEKEPVDIDDDLDDIPLSTPGKELGTEGKVKVPTPGGGGVKEEIKPGGENADEDEDGEGGAGSGVLVIIVLVGIVGSLIFVTASRRRHRYRRSSPSSSSGSGPKGGIFSLITGGSDGEHLHRSGSDLRGGLIEKFTGFFTNQSSGRGRYRPTTGMDEQDEEE
ncbi:hypothetical protein HDV05_008084, partial [Chytridiales sp. JEL 0842]